MMWLYITTGLLILVLPSSECFTVPEGKDKVNLGQCIFDEIQADDIPVTYVKYETLWSTQEKTNRRRTRRQTDQVYRPIRIVPYFSDIQLGPIGEKRLRDIISVAIKKISRLLSVIPVSEPLRLKRTGCLVAWRDGPNKGKCAKVIQNHPAETCVQMIQIPDDHLEGLSTWNATYSEPIKEHIKPGRGVPNADYILYVQANSGGQCQKSGRQILASTFLCQLDQNDRPVAGYVNFCPDMLVKDTFNHERYSLTALHELFHALGFSKKLFDKFRECGDPDCDRHSSVTGDLLGVTRLITPAVVKRTQQHFNCPGEQDFGAPLETKDDVVDSHWHPRFFQGSIMTPAIGLTNLTLLDPFTLALFEDTGWYKVDHSGADDFTWGKGEGCNFGLISTCQTDTDYFCTGSGSGCHYTHLTKGHCDTDVDLSPCRVFIAKKEENCSVAVDSLPQDEIVLTGQEYTVNSRCFVANLTLNTTNTPDLLPMGMCFQYNCTDINVLMIKTSTTNWQHCPFDQYVTIPGYSGSLRCPKLGTLCTEAEFTTLPTTVLTTTVLQTESTQTETRISTTAAGPTSGLDPGEIILVEIVFPSLSLHILEERDLVPTFVESVLKLVIKATGITEQQFRNVNVKKGSVKVLFDITPAEASQKGPSTEQAYNIVEECIDQGNFTVNLPGLGSHTATMISKRTSRIKPTDHVKSSVSKGGIAGIVIGAVAVLVVVLVTIVIINKYKMAPPVSVSPSPRRAATRDMAVVYTHRQDRPNQSRSKQCSFTDLKCAARSKKSAHR